MVGFLLTDILCSFPTSTRSGQSQHETLLLLTSPQAQPTFMTSRMNVDPTDLRGDDNQDVSRRARGVSTSEIKGISFQDAGLQTTAHVKQIAATNESVRSGVWQLEDFDVPTLPTFYPLERSAVFVPDEKAASITGRISAELRNRSIEATFEQNKAKCVTAEGVEFRIKLFRGRKQYSNGVIVEVQRRFGVSTHFFGETMAILQRAENKKVTVTTRKATTEIPLSAEADDSYEADGSSSLAMVSKMLEPSGHDAQSLGLQTLVSLTDQAKIGESTAKVICKELVKPGNAVGMKVLSILTDSTPQEGEERLKIRTLAMNVLANTVQCAPLAPEIQSQVEPLLLEALLNAESNQRQALFAAKCVEKLGIDCSSELMRALEVGKSRHLALERQVSKCLEKLGA